MEIIEILKKYSEDKLIKLIKKNKLNINLEELLIESVNVGYNKLSIYLINKGVSFEYIDNLDYDCYLMAINRGNIDIIKSLMAKGLNLFKKYTIDKEDTYAIGYVTDLDTFKFFEEHKLPKKIFNNSIEKIVYNTICSHDIELLSYLIDNYHIDITKFVYKTPYKNYTILDKTKELLDNMLEKEKRKREMTFFIDSVFCDRKYSKEIKRAYEDLKEIEKENKNLTKYYQYVKKQFID